MLRGRQIFTSAIRHSKKNSTTPIKLQICLPPFDRPFTVDFASVNEIKTFLQPNRFFSDPLSNKVITIYQLDRLNPDTVYDIIGEGFTYRHKGLSREKVVDKVFEEKAALSLREILKKRDPAMVELPRIIQEAGKDVAEWEGVFEMSNGCITFLEAKFRMSMDHVHKQRERMTKSLRALGKEQASTQLYLAAYFWHDDKSCLTYTRDLGYGIIRPNGRDLSVEDNSAKEKD